MFVDASALVAILTEEAEGQSFAQAIEKARECSTSPLAIFETVLNIRRKLAVDVDAAIEITTTFIDRAGITVEPIDRETGGLALSAFSRYGKGRGHPAQLNLGDCFAYAMARRRGVPLLYKGGDFARTDIAGGHAA